jgi:hypothetical protein
MRGTILVSRVGVKCPKQHHLIFNRMPNRCQRILEVSWSFAGWTVHPFGYLYIRFQVILISIRLINARRAPKDTE